MKFLLLLHGDDSGFDEAGTAEIAQVAKEIQAFGERHADVLLTSNPLAASTEARTVRFTDQEVTLTDGPFTEAKEVIGGFHIVDVPSVDDAIAIARDWPVAATGNGAVEVRAVLDECPVMTFLDT